MSELKRTPLFPHYAKYGAKTIDFGGWELPVQFSSIIEEHEAVRNRAGLFDVSHMGEVIIRGKDALSLIQYLVTNDASKIEIGQAIYSPMCYPEGGIVDDLLIYRTAEEEYLLVVNASNTEKDMEWIEKHREGDVEVVNISNDTAQIAIQGPLAQDILQKLTSFNLGEIGFFRFKEDVEVSGKKALVSRSGYTGEDGFEIYCSPEDVGELWNTLLEVGKSDGLLPCGLGSRDTLRFEAKLPLYGQELSPEISPLEAGLGMWVKLDKEMDFVGKEFLKEQKAKGVPRKIVGIEMIDRGIPRHGYPVFVNDTQIGTVTTGTQSPTLKKNVGLVLINSELAKEGQEVFVEIRGKHLKAVIVKTPFYRRNK